MKPPWIENHLPQVRSRGALWVQHACVGPRREEGGDRAYAQGSPLSSSAGAIPTLWMNEASSLGSAMLLNASLRLPFMRRVVGWGNTWACPTFFDQSCSISSLRNNWPACASAVPSMPAFWVASPHPWLGLFLVCALHVVSSWPRCEWRRNTSDLAPLPFPAAQA